MKSLRIRSPATNRGGDRVWEILTALDAHRVDSLMSREILYFFAERGGAFRQTERELRLRLTVARFAGDERQIHASLR